MEDVKDVVLDIQDVKQFNDLENVSEKIKSMIIDQTIEDEGDNIKVTFILAKNKGDRDE